MKFRATYCGGLLPDIEITAPTWELAAKAATTFEKPGYPMASLTRIG